MDVGGSSLKIDKLSSTNFHAWKQKIQLVLSLRELDDHIDEDPPERTDASYTAWMKADRKAKAIIGLSLSDEHLEHVIDADTAKEMWQSIMDIFERHTLLNKLAARRNFYTAVMLSNEKILSYINRIRQLASTLKSMNVHIDDIEMALAVLNGLPERFGSLISALDALGNDDDTFSLDLVKSRLLQEEQRMDMRAKASHIKLETSALIASNSRRPVPHCGHCSKRGHVSSKCWEKFPHLMPDYVRKAREREAAQKGLIASDSDIHTAHSDEQFCLMTQARRAGATKSDQIWIMDSGATSHMTFDRSAFHSYVDISDTTMEVGTKARTRVSGKGNVYIKVSVNNKVSSIELCNVLHVPELGYQLLSIPQVSKKGCTVIFKNDACVIHRQGEPIIKASLIKSLYILDTFKDDPREIACVASLRTWHERLAHIDQQNILHMARNGVAKGLDISKAGNRFTCSGCIYGKGHQKPIPKASLTKTTAVLQLVHSDVLGPVSPISMGGSSYFVSFIDDFSKWTVVYLMSAKSETFNFFQKYHRSAERHTGKTLKCLRSDNGG